MLSDLIVEGIGVIERAEIAFGRGCSALTGETGAGKTLVVAAVGLLLGGRGERSLVRRGASEARVEGRFVVPAGHPVVGALVAGGLVDPPDDGSEGREVEVVAARSVPSDGARSGRAWINGRLVTAGLLGETVAALVELAGQNEHLHLTTPSRRRALLDSFAGEEAVALARALQSTARRAAEVRRTLEDLKAGERERGRELDLLRHEVAEIEAAAVEPGEMEALRAQAARLEHAEAIAAAVSGAVTALRAEGGAEELVAGAAKEVEIAARNDPSLEAAAERLRAVSLELGDLAGELRGAVVAPDPEALEATRVRIAAITRLWRKYGDGDDALTEHLQDARARVAELEGAHEDLDRVAQEASNLTAEAEELARALSEARRAAAPRLEEAVVALLDDLALPGAAFEVLLVPCELGEGGLEDVEFLVAADPGETPRPLQRVASGGELSRIALALHLLTTTGSVTTMIFDEVDAGVGGLAARAVGRCLAQLAREAGIQVIVVTHLPQVAAFADSQYKVAKVERSGRTGAIVTAIEGEERIAELSRMLAGLPESERAREHAAELLGLAAQGSSR